MSGFLEKYNTDEVFLRSLITAFLRTLNEKLKYRQVNDQQQILEVFVPFYYSMTGDEPFLQDFFLHYRNCETDALLAEGNYDVIPRGIVTIGASEINTQSLGNKFVRTSYAVETVKGEMKTFSSYTNSIPLSISFDITIKVDTLLDAFKIYQSTLTTFYKTYPFSFEFEGYRIPAQVGFPEGYEMSKQLEFTYLTNPQLIDFKFSVACETYFPERDLTTERFRGNLMQAGIKMEEIVNARAFKQNSNEIL